MGGLEADCTRALEWLESHINLETLHSTNYRIPTLDRIVELSGLLADPHKCYPVIHVTGTNGKGSVVRIISELLRARGLTVGTYTSPDLESVTERIAYLGVPISKGEFAENIEILRLLEPMMEQVPSRFELLTALAFKWFADLAVDVAVVEVGLGGRWDATNIVESSVSVITNIELDHTELLGNSREEIAHEKAGIIKEHSITILGETDPMLYKIFSETCDRQCAELLVSARDFECVYDRLGIGGHLIGMRIGNRVYDDLFVPLHGRHQVDNALVALAAFDSFFARGEGLELSKEEEILRQGLSNVRIPGRLEVISTNPLTILDGAHNVAGAKCIDRALTEEFDSSLNRVLIMGLLKGRDIKEMICAFGVDKIESLIACPAPSPRSIDPNEIVDEARQVGINATVADSVEGAIKIGLREAKERNLVLITGSLYVVGKARAILRDRSHIEAS